MYYFWCIHHRFNFKGKLSKHQFFRLKNQKIIRLFLAFNLNGSKGKGQWPVASQSLPTRSCFHRTRHRELAFMPSSLQEIFEILPLWGFAGLIVVSMYSTISQRNAKLLLDVLIPLALAALWIIIYSAICWGVG